MTLIIIKRKTTNLDFIEVFSSHISRELFISKKYKNL